MKFWGLCLFLIPVIALLALAVWQFCSRREDDDKEERRS